MESAPTGGHSPPPPRTEAPRETQECPRPARHWKKAGSPGAWHPRPPEKPDAEHKLEANSIRPYAFDHANYEKPPRYPEQGRAG
jgi:hypothetical protein